MGERILEKAVRDGEPAKGAAEDDDSSGHGLLRRRFDEGLYKIRSCCIMFVFLGLTV